MKRKILSLLTAFAMVFGIIAAPFTASAADAKNEPVVEAGTDPVTAATHKTDVVIHKMELKDLQGWPKKAGVESNGHTYDGSKLDAAYFGNDATELDGVIFYYYKVTDKANYDKLKANSGKYMTKKAMDDAIASQKKDEKIEATYVDKVETADGNGATVPNLENGYYWFVEDQDSVSRDGRTFSAAAAVPFGLSLPYANKDGKPFGTGDDALHVYPKNTLADKPVVDKDFKGKANPEKPRSADEKNVPESHDAGDIIEYEIKTVFQANTEYQTAFWTDQMTEGLTFNQDSLKVAVGDADLTKETDYTLDTTTNTFMVKLTPEGLKKVNKQKEKVTVTVSYTATLNEKAKVDIPESNDVVFHYGNNPSKGNTPKPNKPDNGKITFTKTWDGDAPKDASITVQLYDANTGEKIGPAETLNAGNKWTKEWTGLDNSKNYKVVEEGIDGYDAEYTTGEGLGKLGAKNWKTNNPKPLNPDEPKVVTYGKKFVKMEQGSDVRLKDAKFVIKNAEGKFLGTTASQATKEKGEFDKAQQAYVAALEAYNTEVAKQEPQGLDGLKTTLAQKKKERDDAFTAYVKAQNKWVDEQKDALVLTSDAEGRFEIKGLAKLPEQGKYELVEIEKPKGYAAIKDKIEFTVDKGTYAGKDTEVQYNKDNTDDGYGQRVDNKKVTIPETGGIGSLVFIAAGLVIMGGAFIAYKRTQATA